MSGGGAEQALPVFRSQPADRGLLDARRIHQDGHIAGHSAPFQRLIQRAAEHAMHIVDRLRTARRTMDTSILQEMIQHQLDVLGGALRELMLSQSGLQIQPYNLRVAGVRAAGA